MALTPLEVQRCKQALAAFLEPRRPPPHLREQVDLGFELTNQSVELFEVRPDWSDPTKTARTPIAKATFVRTRNIWRVYWMRRDLRWHSYEPRPVVDDLVDFLETVDADDYGCFFG